MSKIGRLILLYISIGINYFYVMLINECFLFKMLYGLLPLEDMDLIVHPHKHELVGAHGGEMEYMAYEII
jgi:hypothetical protein